MKNLSENVKRAGKNVKNATDDLTIAVSENLKGEGNGIFEDYERKTEGTEMALQMAIKQEEITNIISNPEEHSQEELQGAITALVGSTSGAEVNFYEGDELTDDQRMTVDGEDKSALPGFYDAEGNTIYLNADKTNSISDLLTVTRHENQHAIDDQDGVDYTTYSQDKDHYEDLAKKSESEFMYSLAREFGDNPNKESTSAFTDMDAGSNGAGGVDEIMPWTLQVGLSGSGGLGAGGTVGGGLVIANDEETGDWTFGIYSTEGVGGVVGYGKSLFLDFTFSDNDNISELSGFGSSSGGSYGTGLGGGYEYNVNRGAKPSQTYSIGATLGAEAHGFGTYTTVKNIEKILEEIESRNEIFLPR